MNLKKAANQFKIKVADEEKEIVGSAKSQLGVSEKHVEDRNLVRELILGTGKPPELPPDYETKETASSQSRLSELEAQLKQISLQRGRQLQEYGKSQTELINPQKPLEVQEPIVQTSRRKRFAIGGKGKAKGSGEMLKAKK